MWEADIQHGERVKTKSRPRGGGGRERTVNRKNRGEHEVRRKVICEPLPDGAYTAAAVRSCTFSWKSQGGCFAEFAVEGGGGVT